MRRRAVTGALYATPAAILVALFFVVPLLLVAWMSLHRWPLLGSPKLNLPANYSAIADNALLGSAAWFTVRYTVIITVLLFVVAFGLALLVQNRRRGVGFFRTAFFLPVAVGFASASLLFLGLLSEEVGPLPFSGDGPALGSVVLLVLWRFAGFNMLILLTGLQAIPVDVYEAARIDGATRLQMFLRITVPLMRPTIALVLTMMVTGSLLAFDQFWILTRGGPDNSTTSLVMVIYREAFVRLDLGSAAGISVVLLVLLAVLSSLQFAFLRRRSA
ncbi:carbohydrate ABC transporter membrane protein 1, CUT1 family [Lentzea waywayandensis]|uniref:Carbohydrate ABC transporter membrane protein 1, CUT1 family n=1 Tax=Lentzea waywayandensis TaxID=84724 RepID=A0A1I6DB91_9PSEU|nr:sugar ABC transporter permease [Lentzea waywayandensis]SFR02592.1 carbohydrate ABC transporter membrane protein 1, CUT1 family [Lentzea waywayandensis]